MEDFSKLILPSLKKFAFVLTDPPHLTLLILFKMELIAKKLQDEEFRSQVIPFIYTCMQSKDASISASSLKCIPSIISKLDFIMIKNTFVVTLLKSFHKDAKNDILILSTLFAIIPKLDRHTIVTDIVPILISPSSNIDTPEYIMTLVDILKLISGIIEYKQTANIIIRKLWELAFDECLGVSEVF